MQIVKYKCMTCNEIRERMSEECVQDVEKCVSCIKKEFDKLNPSKFYLDGAPSGFVRGGTSNKAGFSKRITFEGK